MSSIRNTVLLYRASLSVWTARKLDKSESSKVAQDAGAIEGAANVHKQLLPDCQELREIQSWAGNFRTFVYLNTLPWDDSGWRAGNVARHMDFMQEIGDRIALGETLVDNFCAVYEAAIAKAQFQLGAMFNPAEYETVVAVRRKFAFAVDVQPIPIADDFRVVEGIPPDEVDKLVGKASQAADARLNAAMEDAYQRLYDVVAKMASTLDAYGAKEIRKFNDTLVGNIAELVEVMPALNLTGDPKLAKLAEQAKALTTYSLVDLRKDDGVRDAAAHEARALAQLILPCDAESSAKAAELALDLSAVNLLTDLEIV